ncbi:MAG: hypothetical protein OEO23_07015 [Gemmatimonadota bacterium]|nr:hypothetical protein [Gemmatimonadota bacterium]
MRNLSIPGLGLGRMLLAYVAAWVFRVANGAGVIGVLVGGGESVPGHVADFATAVPDGFRTVVHYLHGDRHMDELARTMAFLQEDAPTPDEVRRAAVGTRSWLNRLDLARGSISEGLGELAEGELILGISDVRWGLTNMPPPEELDSLVSRARSIVEPTMAYLAEVELDPLMRAAANASDNLAEDERWGTLFTMVLLGSLGWIAGSFVVTVWIRRGLPSFFGRVLMRAGTRTFPAWYAEHGAAAAAALGLPQDRDPGAEAASVPAELG